MSAHKPHQEMSDDESEDEAAMLGADEAEEEIEDNDDDVQMDSGDEEMQEDEVILLQNDSIAHFDKHTDSIFCIAQHPTRPEIVATGGGDDLGYVWETTPPPGPVLPTSYESNPQPRERKGQEIVAKLDGHKDSINGITFTLPKGEYVVTAGLDSQVRVWHDKKGDGKSWTFLAEASEDVEDINWIAPCPSAEHPNAIALATVDPDGMPNARMVLLKEIEAGSFVFYTNYESAKAKELVPEAIVIDPKSDLKLAARRVLWGRMLNAGQVRLRKCSPGGHDC